jgi:hypothetical protein
MKMLVVSMVKATWEYFFDPGQCIVCLYQELQEVSMLVCGILIVMAAGWVVLVLFVSFFRRDYVRGIMHGSSFVLLIARILLEGSDHSLL